MTLGFAAAAWTKDGTRTILVAADSRISLGEERSFDAGIKTYELGGPCAVVVSGHAMAPLMAADLTRSLVEGHNRIEPERLTSFFTTIKFFSFFARRAAMEQGATSRMAAVGFLERGEPCIATITVSPDFNRTNFKKLKPEEVTAVPVGDVSAARLMLEAMATARRENRRVVPAAVGMLYYISKNEGAFRSVGGGLSVGTCTAPQGHFAWPVVEVDGTRFLRGLNVTDSYRSGWPQPEVIPYDEGWCAALDRQVDVSPRSDLKKKGTLPGYDIDVAISPDSLFTTVIEPDLDVIPYDRIE